jgi:hypothetical protein
MPVYGVGRATFRRASGDGFSLIAFYDDDWGAQIDSLGIFQLFLSDGSEY